jgi:hypothetical protein
VAFLTLDRSYTPAMKVVLQGRLAQAASKYGEHAPMAAVCCNACRTCATTNIAAAALAALGGVGIAATRLTRRIVRSTRPEARGAPTSREEPAPRAGC